MQITIVGGGISGLATAYFLEQAGYKKIRLLEASDRLGGVIRSRRVAGCLIEEGPESLAVQQAAIFDLLKAIGLEDEVIAPQTRNFLLGVAGELRQPPKGMVALVPTDLEALEASNLFTEAGKKRILEEEQVPTKQDDSDESLAVFMRRRFGQEMMDRYAGILLAGIHSADPERLSMGATFPQFLRLEQRYGSLTAASRHLLKRMGGKARSPFVGLRNGLESIIDKLEEKLQHTEIYLNSPVRHLSKKNKTYQLHTPTQIFDSQQVVLSVAAPVLGQILGEMIPEIPAITKQFKLGSSIVLTYLFHKKNIALPKNTSGFLLGADMRKSLHACTFSSQKWENRCPEDRVIVRSYHGGNQVDALQEQVTNGDHAAILKELGSYVTLLGPPDQILAHPWKEARPVYELGHLDLLAALDAALLPFEGLHLLGASYRGVGISACVQQAKRLVEVF